METRVNYEVTRIRPDTTGDPDRTIDLVEVYPGPLYFRPEKMAEMMLNANDNFYVTGATLLDRVYLEPCQSRMTGRRWVRTIPNGVLDDNLYSLPQF
jgi:hypothetical protein